MRLLALPDALRRFGLEPVEVAGWQTDGYELTALKGCLDHHTAGAATGYMPSLGVLVNGRADLPPRLANVGAPRSEPGDMRVYVITSGKANHAGAGFLDADASADSNYELAGLERELVGDGSDLTPHRHDVACRVHAAFLWIGGFGDAQRLQRHATYATPDGRKIDTAGVTDAALRERTNLYLAAGGGTIPSPAEVTAMEADYVRHMHEIYLGAAPDARQWDNPMRASFDWHLWRLNTGQTTREGMRADFANTARSASPPRL